MQTKEFDDAAAYEDTVVDEEEGAEIDRVYVDNLWLFVVVVDTRVW